MLRTHFTACTPLPLAPQNVTFQVAFDEERWIKVHTPLIRSVWMHAYIVPRALGANTILDLRDPVIGHWQTPLKCLCLLDFQCMKSFASWEFDQRHRYIPSRAFSILSKAWQARMGRVRKWLVRDNFQTKAFINQGYLTDSCWDSTLDYTNGEAFYRCRYSVIYSLNLNLKVACCYHQET